MSRIGYKAAGNANPQGKPRVWFCAHPDDYALYRDAFIADILSAHSCAVYFDKTPNEAYASEQLAVDLSDINLFVMPVTARLLNTSNRALDVEFPLAVKRSIPVLPVLMDDGIDDLFNHKCGSLHFIRQDTNHGIATSYKEKLQAYLSSVLVGDALADQVREAFDAYLFLSYRKKDRKYAQELMRLIHKYDFCRDIAIWYDEFLVPGEDFNNSIQAAMERSRLFVLAVTPNLLEDGNYVMEVEYKQAINTRLPILAVELVSTDHAELSKKFAGIPPCADAHNALELSQSLGETLSSIALRKKDHIPFHNYLIGLAYLYGIDVEVDFDRALHIIRSAAEDGLQEAMCKLAAVHYNLNQYAQAIDWQTAYCNKLKQLKEADPSVVEPLLHAYMTLGDYHKEANQFDLADSAYNSAYLEASVFSNEYLSAHKVREITLRARSKEAEISTLKVRDGTVHTNLTAYLEEAKSVYSQDPTPSNKWHIFQARKLMGDATYSFGRDAFSQNDSLSSKWKFLRTVMQAKPYLRSQLLYKRAQKEYSLALQEAKDLYAQEPCTQHLQCLWEAHLCRGKVMAASGKPKGAAEHLHHALDIANELSEFGEKSADLFLSKTASAFSQLIGMQSEAEVTLPYLQGSLDNAKKYDQKNHSFSSKSTLAICYQNLGVALFRCRRLDEAESNLKNAYSLLQSLVDETHNHSRKLEMIDCCFSLSDLYRRRGLYDQANKYNKQSAILILDLQHKTGYINTKQLMYTYWIKRGDIAYSSGAKKESKRYYTKARNEINSQHVEPETVSTSSLYAEILEQKEKANAATGIKRYLLLQKARYMAKKLLWSFPIIPKYQQLLDDLHRTLHISEKPTAFTLSMASISCISQFCMEYLRLVKGMPINLISWLLLLVYYISYLFGFARIFSPFLFSWSSHRNRKKVKEKRTSFFDFLFSLLILHSMILAGFSLLVDAIILLFLM